MKEGRRAHFLFLRYRAGFFTFHSSIYHLSDLASGPRGAGGGRLIGVLLDLLAI